MKQIPTVTHYLEMKTRSEAVSTINLRAEILVMDLKHPDIEYYRFLYNAIGKAWNWFDRKIMTDEQLLDIINNEKIEIYVIYYNGNPAGFVELDRSVKDEIEIVYFGLLPSYIGKGLGRYFMNWTLNKAWRYHPTRVWLHTCDLDHPGALEFYKKFGFEKYDEKVVQQTIILE